MLDGILFFSDKDKRQEGGRLKEGGAKGGGVAFLPVVGRTAEGTLWTPCRSRLVPKRLNMSSLVFGAGGLAYTHRKDPAQTPS